MSDNETLQTKRRRDKEENSNERLSSSDYRKRSLKSDKKSERDDRRRDRSYYDDRKRKHERERKKEKYYDYDRGDYDDKYTERKTDKYSDREKLRYEDESYDKPRFKSYYQVKSPSPEPKRRSPSYEPENKYPRYYGSDTESKNDSRKTKSDKKGVSNEEKGVNENKEIMTRREKKTVDLLTSKTGGAYIPPARLRMMQAEITDKSSAAYQRIAWEALKKSIHGFINKINVGNIGLITKELLRENIVRGRGLLCKSIIQAQAASPTFTHVYAALTALINVKFPNIGELLLKRLVLQFKRSFKRNDKSNCIAAANFVAHLVNQRVAHEILALEILTLLVESPTDDSVEVAIAFLKECGQKLSEVSPKGINAIFEMLRNILHEGQLDKRIQYMIEVIFQVRKDGFKDHAAIIEELDLVEEEDQFTHLITLDDVKNGEEILSK